MTFHRLTNIFLGAAYIAALVVCALDLFFWRPG
jgi:hypothetical protein